MSVLTGDHFPGSTTTTF